MSLQCHSEMCNAVSLLALKYDRKELVLHAYYWLKAKEITNYQPPMVLDAFHAEMLIELNSPKRSA